MRGFLLLLASTQLHAAAAIAVDIHPDRHIAVHEHFPSVKTEPFEFLVSPCARIQNLRVDGTPVIIPVSPSPWISIAGGADLSYDAIPIDPNPSACAIPLLMPKKVLDSVSLTINDLGSDLANVALPQMTASLDRKRWTAILPAVPSKIALSWRTGSSPPASNKPLETGLFFWNFWGLVTILIIWTLAYLAWARRQA